MANLGVSFGPFNFFQLLFFKHFKQHVLSCLFGVAATQFNILKHLCQQMGSYRDVFVQRVKRGCAVCFAGACCMSCMSCNGWACWQARLRSPCGGEDSARRRSFRRSRVGVADGIPTGLQTQQRDEKTTGSRITCMLHVPATRLYKVEEVVTEPALCSTRWPCLMLRCQPRSSPFGASFGADGRCHLLGACHWDILVPSTPSAVNPRTVGGAWWAMYRMGVFFRTVLCYSYNYPLLI